jgi:phosphoribosylamine--glycine ligase
MINKFKVLVYGGGAREHALVWKIKQSPLLEKLYLCKPNDGFAELGEVIDAENFAELAEKSKNLGINLLVVGPEDPLANGIVDEFKNAGIPCVGVDKKWAKLESSKSFAKEFMERNSIPTARYKVVTSFCHPDQKGIITSIPKGTDSSAMPQNDIFSVLDEFNLPVVLKADGLAAGKGVFIAQARGEAEAVLEEFLEGKYGEASKKIVVEEFLEGSEISLISLWDGKNLLPLIPARDYKRLLAGNEGPNTGGMGAYCPVSLTLEEYTSIDEYTNLLKQALLNEKADFVGIVYSGLMMTKDGVKVLEYNMRFGDPETQPLLMHLNSDLLEVFVKATEQKLDEVELKWKSAQTFCVVVAAQGYPENPVKDGEILNIEEVAKNNEVNVFYAGVKKHNGKLLANGGRVLSVCKNGITAQKDIYDAIDQLVYEDKIYRKDIGEVNIFGKGCCKNEGTCGNCGVGK